MQDDLIQHAARLMREQATAYARLESACNQLAAALVRGQPETLESLSRAGESELTRMRSRLVEIMSMLAAFADARRSPANSPQQTSADATLTNAPQHAPLSKETRELFEQASNQLFDAAKLFQSIHSRATALATSGATFASACIETCGVPPTTYRAPYARVTGAYRQWA